MDEYVTKPLKVGDLVEAIEKWAPPTGGSSSGPSFVFPREKLLASLGGDEAALRRLIGIFLESTPLLIEKLRRAIAGRDGPALLLAAHSLKGSLTHLDEPEFRAAARELEALGRAGNFEDASRRLGELEQNLIPLEEALRSWL